MRLNNSRNFPNCNKSECFANLSGECNILTDSYGDRACPFFKTKEQHESDNIKYKVTKRKHR